MTGELNPKLRERIDAALREAGSAPPPPGLEGRVLTRLASARMTSASGRHLRRTGVRLPRPLLTLAGFASAGLMGTLIVVGSVNHSHRYIPAQVATPPVIPTMGTGVGAASAVHPGAPASAPVPAGPSARGRSAHHAGQGRARIAPQAKKAPGVVVPAPASGNPQS